MYRFEPTAADEQRLQRLADFLRQMFPHAFCFRRDYLGWMYFRNPEGPVIGFDAFAGDELVGHYAIIPIRMLHDGTERRGGLAVNIAIHHDHRGHGLFRQITGATHEVFAAAGHDLVVGVANAQSTQRFVERLGFRLVGPLHARIGLAGGCHDPAADGRVALRRLWSPETFAWRFSNPVRSYRFERHGNVTRVYTPTQRFGIEAEMGVFPAGWAPPAPTRRYPWLRHPLKVWLGLRPGGAPWPLSIEIPRWLRPSPLNLIIRDTRAGVDPTSRDGVDFRGADFDPY